MTNRQTVTPARKFIALPAGLSTLPRSIPFDKSPNQSPTLVMTPHHIDLYPMVEEKNECN
jgi:hypothetical protein